MKQRKGLIGLVLVAVVVGGWALFDRRPTVGVERARPDGATEPTRRIPGAILVDLVDDATDEQVAALEARYGIDLEPNSIHAREERLEIATTDDARIPALLERLRSEPLVEVAERDGLYQTMGWLEYSPNDPSYQYQWHMDQVSMPSAWRLSRGRGAVVAVIDTGVAYRDEGDRYRQVPDLAGTRFVPGYDFVDNDDAPLDEHGHGTHVAGTIAQTTNNGVGVTGVAFEASIMPLRVLNRQGFGSFGDIADAIRFAADNGADVINMSLGGPIPSLAIWSAIRYAHSKGVVIVAAAGNSGSGRVGFPASAAHVIAVSATNRDEELAFYSSWGRALDIAAPGGDTRADRTGGVLQNTILPGSPAENDYLFLNGTSMASPHVAGVAALVVAEGVTDPDAVERVLERTARGGEDRPADRFGAGIVDAARALHYTQLRGGALQLALALLFAGLGLVGLRKKGLLESAPGPGMIVGLVAGSSGLFFLPALVGGLVPSAVLVFLSHPVMAWDLGILGPGGHANPLFHSALIPMAAALTLFGASRMRGLISGFAFGGAAYLAYSALWGTVDVTWIPFGFLDTAWLLGNALVCGLLGVTVLRKKS